MKILVFNCGSSSLKFDVVEVGQPRRLRSIARGRFEEIGPDTKYVFVDSRGRESSGRADVHDHASAALWALSWMESVAGDLGPQLDAVAHRVVHGGEGLTEPAIADEGVMRTLTEASRFAPIHNPPALATIRAVNRRLGAVTQVVVADTMFHQTLPSHARFYAIPRDLAQRHGIRRFGFHGIGHAYMMERYAEIAGAPAASLNLVTLQLGAGCSATAIREGRSVDTSMGLTPLEGLMMGTRSGDIDPAIFAYLAAAEGAAPTEVERILNRDSGLLGVSGCSEDIRDLQVAADADASGPAALAIEMFCYRVRKYIGAYIAALGRVDAIVFGGGIGEHADRIRERVCTGLEKLGIVLNAERNRQANGREACISAPGSPVKIHVIPLDEELYIARAAARIVGRGKPAPSAQWEK
jgi:acetate kinase